jgi:hypothetical protein
MTIFVANFKTNKMKKYLFLTLVMAFTFSVSAQKLPSTKKLSKEAVDKTVKVTENTEEQVKTALLKDKGLQKEALSFLKSNPETTVAMAGLATKSMGSSSSDLMKSVLGNKDLATAAINYITSNPKLLQKAMKIVGM